MEFKENPLVDNANMNEIKFEKQISEDRMPSKRK